MEKSRNANMRILKPNCQTLSEYIAYMFSEYYLYNYIEDEHEIIDQIIAECLFSKESEVEPK